MSEENNYESLFNENLQGIDTSMPLLAPTTADFTVMKTEVVTNTKDQSKQSLRITLNSTKPLPSTPSVLGKTQMLAATFPHLYNISLTPTENMDLDQVRKNLATICQCLGVQSIGNGGQNLQGNTGSFKVTVQPERTDKITGETYAANNKFRPIPIEK